MKQLTSPNVSTLKINAKLIHIVLAQRLPKREQCERGRVNDSIKYSKCNIERPCGSPAASEFGWWFDAAKRRRDSLGVVEALVKG